MGNEQTAALAVDDVIPAFPPPVKGKRNQQDQARRQYVATSDYIDENGRLLSQKLRYEPKEFAYRRPSGEGWIYNLQGVRRVLYNLPAVIAADEVWIVEGEKDADRLIGLGLSATTAGGAGKWRPEYTETLAGKITHVIPDNDKAGIDDSAKIAGQLAGIAGQVKIVDLPVGAGGDVSDYLDAGGTVEGLRALCDLAAVYEPPGPEERPDNARTVVGGRSATIPQKYGAYGQAALEDATNAVKTAVKGERNTSLFKHAAALFELENGGELPAGTVAPAMLDAAIAAGLSEKEAHDTIESAQETAAGTARTAPDPDPVVYSANGNGAGQVEEIAIPKPINGREFAARQFDPLQFLIDGLIARGHFVLLGGRPKSGKSWLMLTLAMCVDAGLPFLGRATEAARVLYLALEDGQRRVNARMATLDWQPRAAGLLFNIAQFDGPHGDLGPGLDQVAELATDYDLILIDTLIRTLSGRADENSNTQMGALANELARIAHDTETAIIVSHHTGKGQTEDPFERLRGASAIRGGYDVGLLLDRKQGEREAVLHAESRDVDVDNMTLRQAANGAGWEYLGPGFQIESIRAGRKTLNAMLTHPEYLDGLTVADIAEARGVSERAIQQQLKSLELAGHVIRQSAPSTTMGRRPDRWFISDSYRG